MLAQTLAAGVVLGLSALHLGWWRGELRRSGAGWTLVWSAVLALVCLTNGLLLAVPADDVTQGMLLVRFVAHAAAVTLALPAVHAYTDGPPVRALTALLAGWYGLAAVLWFATDLVFAHQLVDGLPVYGPVAAGIDLLPVAVVGVYVARAVRGRELTPVGGVMTTTGFVSAVLVIASTVPPPTTFTELLRGVWVVPLALGLQVLAAARISAVRGRAVRRAEMRDALAAVTNAAWFVKSPEEILDRARTECGRVLGATDLEASLRPLVRDRFVTEFYRPGTEHTDPDDQAFLRDMSRVVSGAAERHTLTTRLREAAFTDALTGLQNRHALDRHLATLLDRAVVESTRVAVLFCDLDGLKRTNDRYGHAYGDQLIVRTAAHLQRVVRSEDFVARHGGDEFVVVISRAGSDESVTALARRIRDEFAEAEEEVTGPSISVGVAIWTPGEIADAGVLIRAADLAMLAGKSSHTGLAVYDEAMHARVTAEDDLRDALEAGVADGQIVAHFQPINDAVTLEVVGLEVLARWRRDGRLRQPAEWLSFAEESGLIIEVGRQMFRAARAGMERFDLPVAVNVAGRQLDEPDFLLDVERSWGTDAWDRLTVEVTESALLYDPGHARDALSTLAERGVKIAIDDFGTGYNSLSRLGDLPLDVLKIDRTFVHDIRSPEGAAVLKAIITLAEAYGLEVVAEGVEHAEELTALVDMGVRTVQGHMLGRPAATLPVRGAKARASAQSAMARHMDAVRWARSDASARAGGASLAAATAENAVETTAETAVETGEPVTPAASASDRPGGPAAR